MAVYPRPSDGLARHGTSQSAEAKRRERKKIEGPEHASVWKRHLARPVCLLHCDKNSLQMNVHSKCDPCKYRQRIPGKIGYYCIITIDVDPLICFNLKGKLIRIACLNNMTLPMPNLAAEKQKQNVSRTVSILTRVPFAV